VIRVWQRIAAEIARTRPLDPADAQSLEYAATEVLKQRGRALKFTRTRATVELGPLGRALVSRSEAHRLVEGLPKFTHVTLDFSGVDVVGQGFCDEVFRVFGRAHLTVQLEPVAMNDAIAFMVARVRES
jgi:hypothetical protein